MEGFVLSQSQPCLIFYFCFYWILCSSFFLFYFSLSVTWRHIILFPLWLFSGNICLMFLCHFSVVPLQSHFSLSLSLRKLEKKKTLFLECVLGQDFPDSVRGILGLPDINSCSLSPPTLPLRGRMTILPGNNLGNAASRSPSCWFTRYFCKLKVLRDLSYLY